MSKLRLLPYRSLAATDVSWGGWWFERDGNREPLPDLLTGWDYASNDIVGLSMEIDSSSVLEATGIEQIELIEAVAVADCPAVLRRFVARERLSSNNIQRIDLPIEVPQGEAAQRLDLSSFLILAEDTPAKPRTASRSGSRLWAGPSISVRLEGDAARFPTEAVSFSALHLENAPWTLSAVFDDVSDSFMGSIRLLVNEDHELGRALLSSPVESQLEARLKLEIFRSLVALASAQGVSEEDEFPQDSVAEVIDSMCRLFLNRSLHEAIRMYERNPLKFDRLLYAGVSA